MPNGDFFKLAIHTDSAAFQKDLRGELARALRAVAEQIEVEGVYSGEILDRTGQNIGAFSYRA